METPEASLNPLLNGWLAYQVIVCRIWARSALYQSGGAFGYRDQLQDAAALLYLHPESTREAILRHAAHQFEAGDVCHWWHPEPLAHGLRTRFSDDLLWLPRVTADYLRAHGEWSLLDEPLGFLKAPELAPGEDEAYLPLQAATGEADLYQHCCLAIDRSLTVGAHGLPLMGTGDWNDGMNRVGRLGQGESVWLGFFLYQILTDWLPICQRRDDSERLARYRSYREALLVALNSAGWDGEWYRRAYDDAGEPLGTVADSECKIDALAQSWAVISAAATPERAVQVMDAVEAWLIDEQAGLIRLLTPPFANTPRDPGYIKGYVAGVRENGGQYTHAACWAVQAMALLGRRDRAMQLLTMISPLSHTETTQAVARYKGEPYVLAADVYGTEPHRG
ncbi:MAG: glycosyl transferase, partial [Gammaproteobacteria bacterium]|nr:glycosyl transferase [Gammaproteobacteria bacterium]